MFELCTSSPERMRFRIFFVRKLAGACASPSGSLLTHRTRSPEYFAYFTFSRRACVCSPGFPFGRRDRALCFSPKRCGRVPRPMTPQPLFSSAFLSRKAYIAFAGAAFLHDLPFFCERLPDKRRFFRFLMHFPRKKPRIRLGFSPF